MDFQGARFWVFYDGECRLCTGWRGGSSGFWGGRMWAFLVLQQAGVRERLGMAADEPLVEMKVLSAAGESAGRGGGGVGDMSECVVARAGVCGGAVAAGGVDAGARVSLAGGAAALRGGAVPLDGREGGRAP